MNRKLKLEELNRLSKDQVRSVKKHPIIVILDDIRSMNNVGSVFRTSDAFLIEKIYLCGITATPPHRDITKTAIGATTTVDWEYREDVVSLIDELTDQKTKVWAIEQTSNSIDLEELDLSNTERIAIILGNEVNGVNQSAIDKCTGSIEIPQFGSKHSLNVSVCNGIVTYSILQKIKKGL